MADHVHARFVTAQLQRDMAAIERSTDRATMWALREVGRKVKQASKKRAPVYQGPRTTALVTTGPKTPTGKRAYGKRVDVVKGELKRSIGSSRRFTKHGPHEYSLRVGPRGGHVHLYAAKQEARNHFMRDAYEQVAPQIRELHAKAWTRAMRK
jgi:hypothetical protein